MANIRINDIKATISRHVQKKNVPIIKKNAYFNVFALSLPNVLKKMSRYFLI
ncbi:MAG: hypothetical protein RIQ78_1666 [Bacteroidota bacterium]|jgi:hypothetical protein